MPTKDTTVLSVRVRNNIVKAIEASMKRKGWTYNRWVNWAITERLRKHNRIYAEKPKE